MTDAVLRADGLAFGVAFPETKRHYKLGRSERGVADPKLLWPGFLDFAAELGTAMERERGVQGSYHDLVVT